MNNVRDFGNGVYRFLPDATTCDRRRQCCPYNSIVAHDDSVTVKFGGNCSEATDDALWDSSNRALTIAYGSFASTEYSVVRTSPTVLNVSSERSGWFSLYELSQSPDDDSRLACCSEGTSGIPREYTVTTFYKDLSCNSTVTGVKVERRPCLRVYERSCQLKANGAAVYSIECADQPPGFPANSVVVEEFPDQACRENPSTATAYLSGECVTKDTYLGGTDDGSERYVCSGGKIQYESYAVGCQGNALDSSTFPENQCVYSLSTLEGTRFSCYASASQITALGVPTLLVLLAAALLGLLGD